MVATLQGKFSQEVNFAEVIAEVIEMMVVNFLEGPKYNGVH